MIWIELVGWGGSFLVLIAYALLSTGRVASASRLYQGMNILGALGMAANGWAHGALPSVFNNVIWMGIGFVAIARLMRIRPLAADALWPTDHPEIGPEFISRDDPADKT